MNIAPIQTYQGPALDPMGSFQKGQDVALQREEAQMVREDRGRLQAAREQMAGILGKEGPVDYEQAALSVLPNDPKMAGALMSMQANKLGMEENQASIAQKRLEQSLEKMKAETQALTGMTRMLDGVEDDEQKTRLYDLGIKRAQEMGLDIHPDLLRGYSPENEENIKALAEMGSLLLSDGSDLTAEQKNYQSYQADPEGFGGFLEKFESGGDEPMIERFNFIKQKFPNMPDEEALRLAQNKLGTDLTVDGNTGVVSAMEGAAEGRGDLKEGEKLGELEAEKKVKRPKVEAALKSSEAKADNVISKIDGAIPKVNGYTAGFFGDKFKAVAGSPAADLQAELTTIKANLGFEALQEMRNNSPTGGALGSIAVQELEALQATWDNLTQSQSPEQLKDNLASLKAKVQETKQRIREAYEADFAGAQGKEPETEGTDLDSLSIEELEEMLKNAD